MTNIFRFVLILSFMSVFAANTSAQKIRKYSNEFLNLGMSASGMAQANAQVANTRDLYAGYYNPAGLSHINDAFQLGYLHSEYFAGIAKIDYFGLAIPIDTSKRSLAVSFFRFGVDDIPNTLFLFEPDGSINYDNISKFSVGEYGVFLSYGQKLGQKFSVGGSLKVIHKKIGPFATAWGVGVDLGAQYHHNNWRVGMMLRDISTTYNAWSFSFTDEEQEILVQTNNEIPSNSVEITLPRLVFGAGYQFAIKNKFFIIPEIDVEMNTDGRRNVLIRTDPMSFDLRAGLELHYNHIVYLRTGIGNFQWVNQPNGEEQLLMQPNIGVGLNIKGLHIDYAFTNLGETDAFYSNVISVSFGLKKKDRTETAKTE